MPETAYVPDPKGGLFTPSREFSKEIFKGHYAGGPPSQVPTVDTAIAYDLDIAQAWFWSGTAWYQ